MGLGVSGGGFLGIALEATPGVYQAPTKFFPFTAEGLTYQQETKWRRPIRQLVDVLGAVKGNAHVEGDVTFEAFEDVVPYFHHCSRTSVVKTADAAVPANYTYVYTPTSNAQTTGRTMSVTIVRNGVVFGYRGCVVNSFSYTIEDGQLMSTFNLKGLDEANQALPVPVYSTTSPFGAGMYRVEVPTATVVFDMDTFTFSVNDNAKINWRLRDDGPGATHTNYGEREVKLECSRDFESRVEYDAYKALTAQSVTITATKGANNSIKFEMPSIIKDSYELALGGSQGDLLMAGISYQGVYNVGAGKAYGVTVKTQENIA